MKTIFNQFLFAIGALALVLPAQAVDIQLSSPGVVPGNSAVVRVQFTNATSANIISFAFYLTNTPALGLPTVAAGPDRPNLTVFVDEFGGGVYRVTGIIFGGPNIGNGHIADLTFAIPGNLPLGGHPIHFLSAPPPDAPPGVNPEVRAAVTSALIPSTGTDGEILAAFPPTVTTVAASAVTGSGATLNAIVNPNRTSANVFCQYSTASDLSGATITSIQTLGGVGIPQSVHWTLPALMPSTTYYFRAVGSNVAGTVVGGTLSFSTLSLVARDATYTRAPGLSLKIKISDIASDANNYPLSVQLGASAQGATLSTNANYIFYMAANDNNDSFTYTVSNGHGQSAAGNVTVLVVRPGGALARQISVSGGQVTVKFYGIQWIQYDVQRALDANGPWNRINPTALTPSPDGSFSFTDDYAPNGSAFYRSIQH